MCEENVSKLTERERQCLEMVSAGFTTPQAAAGLQIGERTVETHISNAMRKLGVSTRAHAIAKAMRMGWLD
ncbi:MAG: response regulator transcription factor [Halioglobus sp.]